MAFFLLSPFSNKKETLCLKSPTPAERTKQPLLLALKYMKHQAALSSGE
jgi:hypothetical protein